MDLPPERITVKRRRDEDPVEALYIQSKKPRPAFVFTLETDARVGAVEAPRTSLPETAGKSTSPATHAISALSPDPSPQKLTTSRRESPARLFRELQVPPKQPPSKQAATRSASRSRPVGLEQNDRTIEATSRMRRFYLARDSFAGAGKSPTLSGGISKSKRQPQDRIACFVEKRGEILNHVARQYTDGLERDKPLEDDASTAETARKRPNATAAERAWREQAWPRAKTVVTDNKSTHGHPEKADTVGSEKELLSLAQELQRFAMEETKQTHIQMEKNVNSHRSLKFQPKPPKPRVGKSMGAENLELADSVQSDDDFVIDTYVRSIVTHLSNQIKYPPQGTDLAQHLETGNFGILVVEDAEDEAFWDNSANHSDTGSVNLSDDEDENAEDYYGNDYPEDEVESDDEFGRADYKFRAYSSDHEEYGDVPSD